MTTLGSSGASSKRLKTWKDIGAFFGVDERTVRRWQPRGLPVHRVPGGGRATVFAEAAELERWLNGRKFGPPTDSVSPAGEPAARREPPQQAVDLYTAATHHSERATPDSLRRAIALYGRAIADDPAYAEAYAGLANAYVRLRLFSAVAESEAYPRARAAAERAIGLDPNLAQAHAVAGFVCFYADWDFARGLSHFKEAGRLDPRSADGRYQYGMALLHSGNAAAALVELEAAQRIDPRIRGILSTRGFVLYLLGRREEGLALIRQVAADDPGFMTPHHYLSMIHLSEGDYPAALTESEIVAKLREDEDRLALTKSAWQAFHEGGGEAMLRAVRNGHAALQAAGREPIYVLAEFNALLGDRGEALRCLSRSIAAREPLALTMLFDPLLRNLHSEAEFKKLAAGIGLPG